MHRREAAAHRPGTEHSRASSGCSCPRGSLHPRQGPLGAPMLCLRGAAATHRLDSRFLLVHRQGPGIGGHGPGVGGRPWKNAQHHARTPIVHSRRREAAMHENDVGADRPGNVTKLRRGLSRVSARCFALTWAAAAWALRNRARGTCRPHAIPACF